MRHRSRVLIVSCVIALAATLTACRGLVNGSASQAGSIPSDPSSGLSKVNHIVILMQENRSFDSYFGQLDKYRQMRGLPGGQVDGLPPNASNPSTDGTTRIAAFHLKTACIEDMSPSWNESHLDWNLHNPISTTPTMDGFLFNAANFAKNTGLHDVQGVRAMGYYDSNDLPYYYFMATQFATSDRWFSPASTRTQPNRLYALAATSAGHAYPPADPLQTPTIFQLLDNAGVSWKIYVTDPNGTFLSFFQPYETTHAANIVPAAQFAKDTANGTLPAVSWIETGYVSGTDEHPQNNVQIGAAYAAQFINALMDSQSWKDSVLFLTHDEGGGAFDHVPPIPELSPDGIKPLDLLPHDIPGDFTRSGFRVPLIVVSPFAKKNYVSHTPMDYTAMLKFIETRFNLPSLNARDAAQPSMAEFFDFQNPPWITPPSPPPQPVDMPCYFDHLP